MTKTTQEQIKVMQAYADGKTIECKNNYHDDWHKIEQPKWNWNEWDYRVREDKEYTLKGLRVTASYLGNKYYYVFVEVAPKEYKLFECTEDLKLTLFISFGDEPIKSSKVTEESLLMYLEYELGQAFTFTLKESFKS